MVGVMPPSLPIFRVRVSDLCWARSCPKRSKLQGLRPRDNDSFSSGAMRKGTQMHTAYSVPYGSFDRRVLRYNLDLSGKVFTRKILRTNEVLQVAGIPDDYRIFNWYSKGQHVGKTAALLEVKTTSKKRLWLNEKAAAAFQLQIYVWIMEPHLARLGWDIHPRHYLEMYAQQDGHLIDRVVVDPAEDIEKEICNVVDQWRGVKRMTPPEFYICKRCPRAIKSTCDWWGKLVR